MQEKNPRDEKKYFMEVGARIKLVRSIFNEGSKLSGDQFAYLLDTSGDKIRNYETGRVAFPLNLLLKLYRRGINPVYVISGEGSMFADNAAGRDFAEKIKNRLKAGVEIEIFSLARGASPSMPIYKAAAGRLKKKKDHNDKKDKPIS